MTIGSNKTLSAFEMYWVRTRWDDNANRPARAGGFPLP
jgi:hypothetical protein